MNSDEREKFIADSLRTAPRRAALAAAMMYGPLDVFPNHLRYVCDFCGWTIVSKIHFGACPKCLGPLGAHETPPLFMMEVWRERPE